jgi:hypothetical protein
MNKKYLFLFLSSLLYSYVFADPEAISRSFYVKYDTDKMVWIGNRKDFAI